VARTFNGSTAQIRTAIGGMSGASLGGTTWVAIVRLSSETNHSLIYISDNTDGYISSFDIDSEGIPNIGALSSGVAAPEAMTITPAKGWVLLAASKEPGPAAVNFHLYTFSTGTWEHESTGFFFVDDGPTAASTARIRLGGSASNQGLAGDLAAAAVWRRVLTEGEVEQLANSLLTWQHLAPTAMWVLDQAAVGTAVNDWTGGSANQTAITGTTVATSSAPISYTPGVLLEGFLSIPAEAKPAAVMAPWSVPAPAISTGVTTETGAVVAPWSVPEPDVSLTGSPPTQVQPGAVVAPWSVPAPALRVDVTVRPAPVIGAWLVPAVGVRVPTNSGDDLDGPGQLSLNGFKMGGGTPYGLDELVGADIDLPGIDNGNVLNPSSDGAQSGRKLSQPRIITASYIVRAPRDQMRDVAEAFRDSTPLADADEEMDLAIQVLDQIYVTRGAVTRRTIPINREYRLGMAKAVLQVECSDPRLYSRELGNASIPDGGTVEVTNLGNRRTRPLVRVRGPALTPRLEVFRTLSDGTEDLRVIEFAVELTAAQTLVIDVARGTAEVGGVSQERYLTGASIGLPDWVLGRGVSEVSYETNLGGAPPAIVLWRHAWL
jgi:hypothetical protein